MPVYMARPILQNKTLTCKLLMSKNILVFIAACAGMFLFGITLITLGSVATDLRSKFHLSGTDAGTLFSILPFGILTGSLIFGPVCDRYGYKTVSYTHLRAHETPEHLVCRLLL